MNINLIQLVALRELSRRGTMAAVADHLGYTPGAVSQQIAALERSVGVALVTKAGRNVVLTDSGAVLARHAGRILAAEREALDALAAVRDDVAAPLLLGTFGSTAASLLPPVVAVARERYPLLDLSSREVDVDDAVAAVQRGDVDVAFGLDYPITPMPRSADVEIIVLRTEPFGLAIAPGAYGITEPRTIDLADAAGWDWIMQPAHTQFGRAVRSACREAGFEPSVRHEVIETSVSIALAARGLGATFVTGLMTRLNSSLPTLHLGLAADVVRRIVLVRRTGSDARPTVRAATEIVRETVTEDR